MGEESKKNTYRSIKYESLSTSQLTGGLDKHLTAGYYQVEINHTTAGETGKVRSISQFKYALNVDGTFSYKTRTGQGNTGISWGNRVDLGAAATALLPTSSAVHERQNSSITLRI